MTPTKNPTLTQIAALLKDRLDTDTFSQVTQLLVNAVGDAYDDGYRVGRSRNWSEGMPLDDDHPTILLIEAIYALQEVGEADGVLDALEQIRENHDPKLVGPKEVIDCLIARLTAPLGVQD